MMTEMALKSDLCFFKDLNNGWKKNFNHIYMICKERQKFRCLEFGWEFTKTHDIRQKTNRRRLGR